MIDLFSVKIVGFDEGTPEAPILTEINGKLYHLDLDGNIPKQSFLKRILNYLKRRTS